ncbi:MAG: S41 family peptidase [Turicibacter sp.]|nr:S41 family peptidase [Turicibacter sp.]
MKKFKKVWLAVFLMLFVLGACTPSDSDEGVDENGYEVNENGYDEEDLAEFGPRGLPLIYLTTEARDIVLEDFDYLAEIMLTNAPQQGIFERRFGLSLEEVLVFLRDEIYYMVPIESVHFLLMDEDWPTDTSGVASADEPRYLAAQYLSSFLMWFAIDVEGLGHFGPQDIRSYWEVLEANAAMLHQTEEIDGQFMFDGEEISDIRGLENMVEVFSSESTLWFFGIEFDDLDLYRSLDDIGFREEGNITTEIIEEGRIAYFHIDSFMNNPSYDSETLIPFFEEVQDFDHLIIDLRGNGGGWGHYFADYVASMLIEEPLTASFNEFITSGDEAMRLAEYSLSGSARGVANEYGILPAYEFVSNNDLPYFNRADLAILEYVVQWELEIEPHEDRVPFDGEIWILVDDWSASASELAAMIAIDSGWATVVGEPTAGVTPAMAMHVSLPHTGVLFRIDIGYLIDGEGRSLEEFGVTPDIVIGPRDDALFTVLDLIQ